MALQMRSHFQSQISRHSLALEGLPEELVEVVAPVK